MIQALKRLFTKLTTNPLFNHGDRIRVMQLVKANKVYTNLECSLDKNMLLLFTGDSEEYYFFVVRTNFDSMFSSENYAKYRDTVLVRKELFNTIKYRFNT